MSENTEHATGGAADTSTPSEEPYDAGSDTDADPDSDPDSLNPRGDA